MKIDSTILNKYLDDKLSLEETKIVMQWLATDEGQHFMAQHWEQEAAELTEEKADEWLDHPVPSLQMKERLMSTLVPAKSKRIWMRWVKVAAVLIPFFFLIGVGAFLADRVGLFSEVEYAEFVVPCGEHMQIVLQDGTTIQLNSTSRLRYPKNFSLFQRKVELWGEAYFAVAKERHRPFVVDLNGVNVRVTGTRFNVKAYPSEPIVQVMLDEGSVQLEDKYNSFPLTRGEYAGYNRSTGDCQITKPEDLMTITGWRTKHLNFYRIPLVEIIKTLERQYDVFFQIPDSSLLNTRFTLSTGKIRIEDILKDLETVSHIRFTSIDEGRTFLIEQEESE